MDVTNKIAYVQKGIDSIVTHRDTNSPVRIAALNHLKDVLDQKIVEIQAADSAAIQATIPNGVS